MKPGKAPQPTSLRLINGNPGKRPISKTEAMPDVLEPITPEHLSVDGLAEWVRIMPLLLKNRLVTEIDTVALALYCQAYGRWVMAERKITLMQADGDDGFTTEAPSGYLVQNPYLSIANRAMEDCHKYLQQFGLSPSSRTRISVSPDGEKVGKGKAAAYF